MTRLGFGAVIAVLAFTGCRAAVAPMAAPPPAPVVHEAPKVLDALGAQDRAWLYADGERFRATALPDLLEAVSNLRVDVRVALAALSAQCGFEPLLSIDELFAHAQWKQNERTSAWSVVLRMKPSPEQAVSCLLAVAPEAQETVLDGHRAWQLRRTFVAWDDGLFVVSSSAAEAQTTLAHMAHPDAASVQARTALAGVLLAANVARPDPFGLDALGVRWMPAAPGSRLDFDSSFEAEANAKHAETITKDSLMQLLGSSASLDPAVHGVAERFVQGAYVNRDGAKLHAIFDVPGLKGEAAFLTRLTAIAVKGERLYDAWDRMGEARDTVYVIARALAVYAGEQQSLGRPARFPPSAPLVPDDIPYGKAVVPNPHAYSFPSWQDIHYTSDRPTFYAYDFVTAKDMKSAVVQARGDIDGDGTTSLFELDVHLDPKGAPVVAPLIRERDPEE